MSLTQDSRILAIATPLETDTLLLRTLAVHEQLSSPFEIEVELVAEDAALDFNQVVGHSVTIRLEMSGNRTRYFNGVVRHFSQSGNVGDLAGYRAVIVPWFWLLTRTSDCRIHQGKSVPEIVEEVFETHGFSDYELRLTSTYQPLEYCVQYRETDFNFVSRLLEQEGIYYFFDHENGKHRMILADSISADKPAEGYEQVEYTELAEGAEEREAVTAWLVGEEIQPCAYALTDFDFKKPNAVLQTVAGVSRKHGAASFEMFDYPGQYVAHDEGERLARIRLDEFQARHLVCRGSATARGLCAGSTFTLGGHPRGDWNREYLITTAVLRAEAGDYRSGESEGGDFFSCEISGIDSAQPFRPPSQTPKPVVRGPQSAIVVGPEGEEIHVDEFGRVKVHFHWDRYGKGDENSSCWIRVAQIWAGKNWGSIHLPRVGQEVIVDFLEGDPDQPVITGRLYNGQAKPPYDLPANRTISALKSNSSQGGGGCNELRLEDKKGEEQIFIQAEKNQDVRIKNDCFEWVGNNRHLIVKADQIEHIENNRSEMVDADHMEKIGKDRHLNVVGKEAKAVGGSSSLTVKGDVIEAFKSGHTEQTTGDYYLKASNIVIEAASNVTIKVGGSYIAMDAAGIKISTPQLELQGTATAEMKGAMATVKGGAVLTLQGGVVKIN